MSDFMSALQSTIEEERNVSYTENGARGYRTTGSALLDLNFSVSSLRDAESDDIINRFVKAFNEDPELAVKWLFFARDIRGGLGERRLFRILFEFLVNNILSDNDADVLINLVPEFGRWDDILMFVDGGSTETRASVLSMIWTQLRQDNADKLENKSISLLAKWLPSINTSSVIARRRAHIIADYLDMDERTYRKTLSKLREYIKVTEKLMSRNDWDKIDYSAVPSKANLLYSNAFLKHDEERRLGYINALSNGEVKVNSGTLYAYEIIDRIIKEMNLIDPPNLELYKGMWNSLPNTIQNPDQNVLVVYDGSYSMEQAVGGMGVYASVVAISIAIYFAERIIGQFKDKVITFSMNPNFIDLSDCKDIVEKIQKVMKFKEAANTNIERVFKLILRAAIENDMTQADLPKTILLVSDMEFDTCARSENYDGVPISLFKNIQKMYEAHGYQIPRIAFWNIASRTGTIPMKENALGVSLVSGFSTNIADMVMSTEMDPRKNLYDKLMSERYKDVKLETTKTNHITIVNE